MQVVDWPSLLAGELPHSRVALTLGVFDSLHLGHQRLIRAVVDNGWGVPPVVCTFRQNPALVLGSRAVPGSILSLRQKMQRLQALGIALVVLIDFSPEISTLTGKRFLELLTGRLTIQKMVVGYNFHMGQGRDTGVSELKSILSGSATELQVVPAALYGGEIVSSSRIRACVREGRFAEAEAMMGRGYALDFRELGSGLRPEPHTGGWRMPIGGISQVLPRQGAYRVVFRDARGERPGAVWIGETEIRAEGALEADSGEILFRGPLEGPGQPAASRSE